MQPRPDHDAALSAAFDGQAARFEVAPIQSDPDLIARFVAFADPAPGSSVLDAGCGPGLVALGFLRAGHRVVGVDLSAEMVARAASRCAPFADRARFVRGSLFDADLGGPFDAVVCRFVLHHAGDPAAFLARMVALARPGGVVAVMDHTTDPDAAHAGRHQEIEALRDRTHVRCLTPGGVVDAMAAAGLGQIRLEEAAFALDFDEWFDRGTPAASKGDVRDRLLARPGARGFRPSAQPDGSVRIDCWRASARGVRPGGAPGRDSAGD